MEDDLHATQGHPPAFRPEGSPADAVGEGAGGVLGPGRGSLLAPHQLAIPAGAHGAHPGPGAVTQLQRLQQLPGLAGAFTTPGRAPHLRPAVPPYQGQQPALPGAPGEEQPAQDRGGGRPAALQAGPGRRQVVGGSRQPREGQEPPAARQPQEQVPAVRATQHPGVPRRGAQGVPEELRPPEVAVIREELRRTRRRLLLRHLQGRGGRGCVPSALPPPYPGIRAPGITGPAPASLASGSRVSGRGKEDPAHRIGCLGTGPGPIALGSRDAAPTNRSLLLWRTLGVACSILDVDVGGGRCRSVGCALFFFLCGTYHRRSVREGGILHTGGRRSARLSREHPPSVVCELPGSQACSPSKGRLWSAAAAGVPVSVADYA